MTYTVPKGAITLGSKMLLFKSTGNTSDCVISAHGGYTAVTRSFRVPGGVTIYFYGPHGASLIDPTTGSFLDGQGEIPVAEMIIGGKERRNYLLSKWQGAHANAEGKIAEEYSGVAAYVSFVDSKRAKALTTLDQSGKIDSPNTTQVKQALDTLKRVRGGSVLTIRNRWHTGLGVPLSDAIKAAREAVPSLRPFHCLFCRSPMIGKDPLEPVSIKCNG